MTDIDNHDRDDGSDGVPGLADLHTHVIPSVDDGAPDLESSLEVMREHFDGGVTTIVGTPHLNASNPRGKRRTRADQMWPGLVQSASERLPDLRLHRGYEIQLDTPDLDLSDPDLRLAGSRFALVEFLAFTVPTRSAEVLGRIAQNGYVPIVAHPERYWGYDRGFAVIPDWRAAGALLQLNAGSLLGEYGDSIRTIAHKFLSEGWVDVIASDNHARPSRSLSIRASWDYLVGHGLETEAALLLSTNPLRILKDQKPFEVGPAEFRRGWLSRLSRVLKRDR